MGSRPELKGRAARLARLLPGAATPGRAARTPFVLLVVLLLGGGLIALLVLNSALSEGAFKLDDLQKDTKALTDEEQALQRDVDAFSAPQALQRRARELGMVPGGDPAFLAPDGTVRGVPSPAAPEPAGASRPLVLAPEALPTTPAPAPGTTTPTATAPAASPAATATAQAPTARAATTQAPTSQAPTSPASAIAGASGAGPTTNPGR
ncbi:MULTISPECIES: septum formation initiator family protein [unclassified Streptomyces]|uniref:septum formation initiator family protein n=1 Tax=unclassified Streptomyces TaxID=2593676 RepID=UPI0033AF5406